MWNRYAHEILQLPSHGRIKKLPPGWSPAAAAKRTVQWKRLHGVSSNQ